MPALQLMTKNVPKNPIFEQKNDEKYEQDFLEITGQDQQDLEMTGHVYGQDPVKNPVMFAIL